MSVTTARRALSQTIIQEAPAPQPIRTQGAVFPALVSSSLSLGEVGGALIMDMDM